MKILLTALLLLLLTAKATSQTAFLTELSRYAYPMYVITNSGEIIEASCFWVKYDSTTFLVTAAHVLFDGDSRMNIQGVSVYLNPHDKNELGWEFNLNDKVILHRRFFNGELLDVVAVPLNASQKNINYVDIDTIEYRNEPNIGKSVYIVGYPEDSLKIVSTKIAKWVAEEAYYQTERPSKHGASGCPVFIEVGNKRRFAGIYVSRNILTDQGIVVKPDLLISILKSYKKMLTAPGVNNTTPSH